jgi:hypothetical protein
MGKITVSFKSNNQNCIAEVELTGCIDSWQGKVKISGHKTIHEMLITYRLGSYITPMFISESEMNSFRPMFEEITDRATELLPKEII